MSVRHHIINSIFYNFNLIETVLVIDNRAIIKYTSLSINIF